MAKKKKLVRGTRLIGGKRVDLVAPTRKEVEAKLDSREQAYKAGLKILNSDMLVRDWAAEWKSTYRELGVVDTTTDNIDSVISRINKSLGDMKVCDVKQGNCQGVLNDMVGMSESWISKVHFYMADMFRRAARNHLTDENPADDLTVPKGTEGSRRALTEYERGIFLKVCETHKYGLFGLVMFYTSCGLKEASQLRGKDVDLKNRILHIPGTKTETRDRDNPIHKNLLEAFRKIPINPFGYVFTDKDGKQLSKTSRERMWDALKKAMQIEAGCSYDYGQKQRLQPSMSPVEGCSGFCRMMLPEYLRNGINTRDYPIADDLTAGCLRTNFCTMLAEADVPLSKASKLMGHKNPAITLRIYTKVTSKMLDDTLELLDAAWG